MPGAEVLAVLQHDHLARGRDYGPGEQSRVDAAQGARTHQQTDPLAAARAGTALGEVGVAQRQGAADTVEILQGLGVGTTWGYCGLICDQIFTTQLHGSILFWSYVLHNYLRKINLYPLFEVGNDFLFCKKK